MPPPDPAAGSGAACRRHGRVPGDRPARFRGARQGPAGPCGDARGRPSKPPGDRRTAAVGPIGPAPLGGALCCGGRRPPDWRVASLPATRGIECETGGVRCLYGRTVRPGWGIRTPVGSNPAVFKTAVIPFRQIRRWWRLLPPLNWSFRRVRCHQVKNGGNLLLGNRGDVQAWAFGVQGRLWTRMRSRAGFGAGWPGMVPAIAGAVYRRRIRRRE